MTQIDAGAICTMNIIVRVPYIVQLVVQNVTLRLKYSTILNGSALKSSFNMQ